MSATSDYCFPEIPYLSLQFQLRSREAARLPAFKGSLLRGAFGYMLRRTVCVRTPQQLCESCFLNRQCAYTAIFETLIHDEPPRFLRGLPHAPRPFVLDADIEQREFAPGEIFSFEMRLLGTSVTYHPFVIFAIHKMAERGFGSRRQRFDLQAALCQDPAGEWHAFYDGATQAIRRPPLTRTIAGTPDDSSPEQLTLAFRTPTRLKIERELSMEFDFRQLVFRMLRRTLELAHFYVDPAQVEWEFHHLLEAASEVAITRRELRWKEQNRYSHRQKADMLFGGFLGEIDLEGNLRPFLPLLRAAEVLHLGKGATFGLGKITLKTIDGKGDW